MDKLKREKVVTTTGDEKCHWTEMQKNVLIDYMSKNETFASGKLTGSAYKDAKEKHWNNVMTLVGKCGPMKNLKQCISCWSRLKENSKKYNALKVLQYTKTGNATNDELVRDEQKESILAIVGTSHKNGLAIGREVGVYQANKDLIKKEPLSSPDLECVNDTSLLENELRVSSSTRKTTRTSSNQLKRKCSDVIVDDSQPSTSKIAAARGETDVYNSPTLPNHSLDQITPKMTKKKNIIRLVSSEPRNTIMRSGLENKPNLSIAIPCFDGSMSTPLTDSSRNSLIKSEGYTKYGKSFKINQARKQLLSNETLSVVKESNIAMNQIANELHIFNEREEKKMQLKKKNK